MSDFFRILRGMEIDGAVRIIHGPGVPGSTPDSIAAPVGSLYLDTTGGEAFVKNAPGPGPVKWTSSVSSGGAALVDENTSSPTPPSAQGNNSLALGSGAQTSSTAPNSFAIGDQSLARIAGGVVQASGRFVTSGDAQAGRYLVRTVSVNNTPTEAFVDGTGGSIRLILPDDSTWSFTMTVTGHRTDVGDGHAGYKMTGVIYRQSGAGTTTIQGKISKSIIAESNPVWDVDVSADTTNGALILKVIGQNGKIIRWLGLVETVEITN